MDLLVFLASTPRPRRLQAGIVDAIWEGRFIADATLTRSMADLRRAFGDTGVRVSTWRPSPSGDIASWRPSPPAKVLIREDAAQPVERHTGAARRSTRESASLVVLPFSQSRAVRRRLLLRGAHRGHHQCPDADPGLRVISRTSAFAAHAQGGDVAEIGRRLGITHVIEGSSRRSAGRDPRDGTAHPDGRPRSRLERALRPRALRRVRHPGRDRRRHRAPSRADARRARPASSAAPTSNMEAYSPLPRRPALFPPGTRESLERAQRCLTDAVRIDPAFAIAHDALSEVFWYLGFYGLMVPKDAFTQAVCGNACARSRSTTATPNRMRCWRCCARSWTTTGRRSSREFALRPRARRALAARSHAYAICGLMPHGHTAEAAAELEEVVESDPLSIPCGGGSRVCTSSGGSSPGA